MNKLAFQKIVTKEYQFLQRAASSVGLEAPAEAVHDVIANVLATEAYKDLDPAKGSIRGFLYRCVRNQAVNLKRRESFETKVFATLDDGDADGDSKDSKRVKALSYDPEPDVSVDVADAIAQLAPLEQLVAEGIYMGNESYESLAEQTGHTLNQIREAGRRCREKLRALLAEYGSEQVGKALKQTG